MGLDAYIHCDCHEKGKLPQPPSKQWVYYVESDGSRQVRVEVAAEDAAASEWNLHACAHEWGILLHERIGNISEVGLLRKAISGAPSRFPIILSKIIQDGSHSGDHIPVDQLPALAVEVERLASFHSAVPLNEEWIRHFEGQLRRLVDTARQSGKPIAF